MNRSTLSRSCIGCGLALLILAGCADSPNPANLDIDAPDFSVWDKKADKDLRVLTWNTYLGGDTGPLFNIDLTDIPVVVEALGTVRPARVTVLAARVMGSVRRVTVEEGARVARGDGE